MGMYPSTEPNSSFAFSKSDMSTTSNLARLDIIVYSKVNASEKKSEKNGANNHKRQLITVIDRHHL